MTKLLTVPLGELVTITGGGTPSRNNPDFYGGQIPWVTPKDMKSWEILKSQVTITQRGLDNSAARLTPANSVLIVVRSGVLKHTLPVALNRVPIAINQDMKALQCRSDVSPEYLAHFIKASSNTILQWVRGTTADNFPIQKLEDLPVPLPSLPEQRRIAEVLDHADVLRVKRRDAIAQRDTLAQAIFLDMFAGASSEAWDLTSIEDVAAAKKAAIRTGPFGSQLLHSEFTDSGVAVLGIDNAVENQFRWAKPRYISTEKYDALRRYTVYPGDVLITIMGTCGRCAVVPDDVPVAINTKHLCCVTLDQARCLPVFLHSYFLHHPLARKYLRQTAKGAVMDGLNMGIIRNLPLRLPPPSLQAEFKGRLAAIDEVATRQQQSRSALDALYLSLLHRAFRGEL